MNPARHHSIDWGRIPALAVAIIVAGYCAASFAQPEGTIAFLAGPDSHNLTVSVLHLASGEIRPVGVGPRDGRPQWSPDGARLAHTLDDGGTRRIRVVSADGSTAFILPMTGSNPRDLRWSPGGSQLACVVGAPAQERIEVYDFAARSSALWGTELPPVIQPDWAAEDRLVAAGRVGDYGSQSTDLFWVTRTRTDPIKDATAAQGRYAEWAPASPGIGDFLAYESDDGGDREIFMYAPQRGAVDVSNHRAADWNPRWSPSRRHIAFESFRGGRRGIYVVHALRVVINEVAADDEASAWDPAWSPDGGWLAFAADPTGVPNLFAATSDGADTVQLAPSDGVQVAPAWRPER
jgi:Tol biopolymer transport system component